MKESNIIQEKSFKFALRVVNLYKYLVKQEKEFILSKQLLKSGTSIGANVEEAIGAQSKKDFLSKISIAYKEARETRYWLKLLFASHYILESHFTSMDNDLDEILRIIGKIQLSIKEGLKKDIDRNP